MYKNEIIKIFADPIFKYKLDNFENVNKDLEKYIYNLYAEDNKGIKRSNQGGWHSQNFQLGIKDTIQNKFAIKIQEYILNCFQNMGWKTKDKNIQIKEMWAIINKQENFNITHTHPNNILSSAYYVKAPKNCGDFIAENSNLAKRHHYPEIENWNELNADIARIKVSEGDLLLFPAYLPHQVSKNESGEDRIVISFNVDIK